MVLLPYVRLQGRAEAYVPLNLDNPNHSEEDCAADDDSDIEHNNCIEVAECLEQQDVSAA